MCDSSASSQWYLTRVGHLGWRFDMSHFPRVICLSHLAYCIALTLSIFRVFYSDAFPTTMLYSWLLPRRFDISNFHILLHLFQHIRHSFFKWIAACYFHSRFFHLGILQVLVIVC